MNAERNKGKDQLKKIGSEGANEKVKQREFSLQKEKRSEQGKLRDYVK